LMAFEFIMRPFATLLTRAAQLVLRAFGLQQVQGIEEAFHSPEELRMLVEQSQEGGALEQTDATLIEGVFEFSEKNAREVMTPRTDIDALAVDATLDDTLTLVEETQRSRYPVFGETIDDLIGRFGLNVPEEDYTTIGGVVFGLLGRLPVVGDRVTAGGAIFTVREMEGRRIETLAVDLHSAGDRRAEEREGIPA